MPKGEIKEEPVNGLVSSSTSTNNKTKKSPGRKRKNEVKQEKITDHMTVTKTKRKVDRFKGMPESEVLKRTLPDHLAPNLDIVIVGINPGLFAAFVGHHYAGPGNHFWKCMFLSGLIPEQLTAYDDFKLLNCGIGFTNIVERTSRGSADLTRKEIKEGAKILIEKMNKYKPKICVFNGKGIYEVFCGHKNFSFGKQPELLEGTETTVYVMPSSSARCAQLPRAVDKVPFYVALRKLRDYLRGDIPKLDDSEVCFPDLELKNVKKEPKQEPQEEKFNPACQVAGQMSFNADSCAGSSYDGTNLPGGSSSFMSVKQEQPFVKQEQPYNPQEYGGMAASYSQYQQSPCTMSNSNIYSNATCSQSNSNINYNCSGDNSQGSHLAHQERLHHYPDSSSSSQLMNLPVHSLPAGPQINTVAATVSVQAAASQMMQCQAIANMATSVALQCTSHLQQYQYGNSNQAMSVQGSVTAGAIRSSFQSISGECQTSSAFSASQRFQFSFSPNNSYPVNSLGQYNGESQQPPFPSMLPSDQCWPENSGQPPSGMIRVKEEPSDHYAGSSCPFQNGNG